MTALPKLRPEVKSLWLAALRGGDYEQGREYLHTRTEDGDERYCCLGVLCDLAVKHGVDLNVHAATEQEVVDGDLVTPVVYGGSSVMPESAVQRWAYGDYVDIDWAWKVEVPNQFGDEDAGPYDYSLAELNDDHGQSFAQIADLIEESL